MKILSRPTPNPNSLKFEVKGRTMIDTGLLAFHAPGEAEGDALGTALFALDGVETLLIVPDFVTVTKHPAADWNRLTPGIEQILRDHLGG